MVTLEAAAGSQSQCCGLSHWGGEGPLLLRGGCLRLILEHSPLHIRSNIGHKQQYKQVYCLGDRG